ncbi:MAG: MotA/TolQ/ExbB proton channel family protein [Bdellovibrionota bacterium]
MIWRSILKIPTKLCLLLAEALILTAVGLLVAIPAVIAFNYFKKKFNGLIDALTVKKNQAIQKVI